MRIYTKSLLTAALALTCSLSLVACGGGGGGGGDNSSDNGGGSTVTPDDNDDSNNNNNKPSVTTDYAWSSVPVGAQLVCSGISQTITFTGSSTLKVKTEGGTTMSGSYTYIKGAQPNQASLVFQVKYRVGGGIVLPYYHYETWNMTMNFKSNSEVYLNGNIKINNSNSSYTSNINWASKKYTISK